MSNPPARPGGFTGEHLFWFCQRLAETRYPPRSGQGKRPSGALIFYFTRLALLRLFPGAVIEPDATPMPLLLGQRFQALAPEIARRLALDYKRVIRLRTPSQRIAELQRFLRLPLTPPRLSWTPAHHVGIYAALHRKLGDLWKTYWRLATLDHVKLLLPRLSPAYLLVTPVAQPALPGKAALELLRQRLADDKSAHTWDVPLPGMYLYDEPLADWLLRWLFSGPLFLDLCQILAELTRAVPTLVQQRIEKLPLNQPDALTQMGTLKQAMRRRIPLTPTGTASAEAIAFYAIAAWRVSQSAPAQQADMPPAAADPTKPEASGDAPAELARDDPLLEPGELRLPRFLRLLELAITAAEHLLWDDSVSVRGRPIPSPEQRHRLRQALLSDRLSRQYRNLDERKRRRLNRVQETLPTWSDWEALRDATCDEIALRLAESIAPADITRATLPDLLRIPTATLGRQYLYSLPFGQWLRDALPPSLPDGDALLRWCQALAETLGAWPPNTPGAPANAEQAARAVFWFTKLALEARIDSVAGAPSPAAEPPQRADGGLVIWQGHQSLPPEALELATVIAPLVTLVLYESSWQAARAGKPLFLARAKAGEQQSRKEMLRWLLRRAQALELRDGEAAALMALDKLYRLLEHAILPADVTLAHLKGDKVALTTLDLYVNHYYNIDRSCYQFLGSIRSFLCSFLRKDSTPEASIRDLEQEADEEEPEAALSPDPATEDGAAREVLGFLVQNALDPPDRWLARDARLLIQGVFTTNYGRRLIERLAQENEPIASKIVKLWQAQRLLSTQGAAPDIRPWMGTKMTRQQIALLHLLASPKVRSSAARRRAVADLFEVAMTTEPAPRPWLRLLELERLIPWVTRTALREELLRVLAALEPLSPAQQKALCARLVGQNHVALTLALLERQGWKRPDYLRLPAAPTTEEEAPTAQNFFYGLGSWQQALPDTPTAWRGRALIAELSGTRFWGRAWAHLEKDHIARFHVTLMDARHPRLRAMLGAAWQVAKEARLAEFAEVIGITGCISPQIPAQLDYPAFFKALWARLPASARRLYSQADDDEPREQPDAQMVEWLRKDWLAARLQTHLWFLTLAGLADENEARVIAAALALAAGNTARVSQWIAGKSPSAAETQELLGEVKRLNPQSRLTAQRIPGLLSNGSEKVRAAWEELGKAPFL